jgi:hypothetical protein
MSRRGGREGYHTVSFVGTSESAAWIVLPSSGPASAPSGIPAAFIAGSPTRWKSTNRINKAPLGSEGVGDT